VRGEMGEERWRKYTIMLNCTALLRLFLPTSDRVNGAQLFSMGFSKHLLSLRKRGLFSPINDRVIARTPLCPNKVKEAVFKEPLVDRLSPTNQLFVTNKCSRLWIPAAQILGREEVGLANQWLGHCSHPVMLGRMSSSL
jgi:hypothetical protein